MLADRARDPGRLLRGSMGSVRVRTTSAAVVVVGATLVMAAVAMVVVLRRSLTADVKAATRLRAEAVEDLLATRGAMGIIKVGDGQEEEDEFVQVLNPEGRVVAYSENVAGESAIVHLRTGRSRVVSGLRIEDDPFLVRAFSANSPEGPVTILAGRTLETVTESSQLVVGLLLIGFPALLVVVAATTWVVVERALAPVEAIRAEVSAISTKDLHRRVPNPPGRDEIARLASTMNGMLSRLQDGQARQRRFVSDAAHELRSPVASIRQHTEVALAHPDRTTIRELAEVVFEEDGRLERIVEDLLLLTKLDEGSKRPQREPVDLDDLLFEEAARLRSTTTLRIDTGGVSAGRVLGNKGQLSRLVRNLADNAARHARSTIAMSLAEEGAETVLRIEDDGKGIPVAEKLRVFDRFVRLEEARDRDSGGSGLGLAIVAEIAAVHGGSVAAFDSVLGGARVEVAMPRLDD